MTAGLFVYGAGGFGKEVMDIARRQNAASGRWTELCFVDDVRPEPTRYGVRLFPFESREIQDQLDGATFVIALGEPSSREKLGKRLSEAGAELATVIDTSALISGSALLQGGSVVAPLCSISSDARLGLHVCVNTMSIVGHDVHVGDYTVISSMVNIGGSCVIGNGSYIGMGALIKEGVRIGSNVIIGMGSVVYTDVPDDVIVVGNPARVARPNTDRKVFK
ncbi:acetyltransferase [Paraburkholderia metrosideri]|uniref:GDP-perosamine N-acetyltransferase n=1 Tax=Paraburkholderia metrosideri TaxID=580937 RepID=A0ABN7HVL8_9BURK|nr:acetyltransferase [Paraburkholderia metrosideri]CAD6540351.1 GDP-perosamine N-acetyltransferase [Paraburkholderia metrosideri]